MPPIIKPDIKTDLLTGLIMAGGQSRRMGEDKALIRLNDGPTLLDLALGKISALVSLWHVSCARGRPREGYPCLEDDLDNFGPAAGILKGLENALQNGRQGVLALACDLPLLPAEFLARLIEIHFAAKPAPLLTAWQNPESGFLETQAAIYNVKALPFFQAAARINQKKLGAIVPAKFQLRAACPWEMARFFLNCNTPETLERAARLAMALK